MPGSTFRAASTENWSPGSGSGDASEQRPLDSVRDKDHRQVHAQTAFDAAPRPKPKSVSAHRRSEERPADNVFGKTIAQHTQSHHTVDVHSTS